MLNLILLNILLVSGFCYNIKTIPSCHSWSNTNNVTVSIDKNQIDSSFPILMASNFMINASQSFNEKLCENSFLCEIDSGLLKEDHILIEFDTNYEEIVICVSQKTDEILFPLEKGRTYTDKQESILQNKSPSKLSSKFYVLKPSSQSLKMFLDIIEGYPTIVPYICPNYGLDNCIEEAKRKIMSYNEEAMSNYFLLLSRISLDASETITIDFCHNCYWLLYIDCKIGSCLINFEYNTKIQDTQNGFKENEFMKVNGKDETSIDLGLEWQIICSYGLSYGTMFVDCSHLNKTYAINVSSNETNVIVSGNEKHIEKKVCKFRFNIIGEPLKISYFSLLLRRMQLENVYSTFLTRSRPGIFHIDLKAPEVFVQLNKCTESPVTFIYYFLPDFESIKSRPIGYNEEDKDTEDWVLKTEVRVLSNSITYKIMKHKDPYLTNYLIIEVIPDSYSYVQISSSQKELPTTNIVHNLSLSSEHFWEENGEIAFNLSFASNGALNDIKIVESSKPDPVEITSYCPKTLFYLLESNEKSQVPVSLKLKKCLNESSVCIEGRSNKSYLGISVKENGTTYLKVIQLNSKISLIEKFSWILALSGVTVTLIFIGICRLLKTKPKKE